ncbi:BREX-5 system adenine-specific DNA-methyltransferase PglX [Natrialba aegyptia]|nr:BREX-5 system adenine-specific DNA-methyltransferase PglX [Natrialba aegyptia]
MNLYLKARGRAEEEGKDDFEMPEVGIVCADAKIANIEAASEVFDEVAGDQPEIRDALEDILGAFENVQGLGSLLDVKGTLEEEFTMEEQPTIMESISGPGSLSNFLDNLHQEVAEQRNGESFLAQDLKSFLRVLVILSQDYDVALMNPPYGSRNRMPDMVKDYVEDHYKYKPEFYINFFEVCDRLTRKSGRVGMLVPRTFMFKRSFEQFREDFIGDQGAFDFLAEFGIGVLDNATVRTVGTVVRTDQQMSDEAVGEFYRLHDIEREEKEHRFLQGAYVDPVDADGIQRRYTREISEFGEIPGAPISYWVPLEIRELYDSGIVFDAENARVDREPLGAVKQGLATADDERFVRDFWESVDDSWVPFAKGGEDAWILPRVNKTVWWQNEGKEVKRFEGSYPRNTQYYFREALTYTYIKEGGRRFGYLNEYSVFSHTGFVFVPDSGPWSVLAYANSNLLTYLMLAQTVGRHWNVGEVSKLPWDKDLENNSHLEELSKDIIGLLLGLRQCDFESPYYDGPLLLKVLGISEELPGYEHPHRSLLEDISPTSPQETVDSSASLSEIGTEAARYRARVNRDLERKSREIDNKIFDHFDIDRDRQQEILREVALRTNEDPRVNQEYDLEEIKEPSDEYDKQIQDLLLHLTIKIAHEDDDGIVPLAFEPEGELELIERLENEFERIFGEYAQDRLAEVDQQLGDKQPEGGAYPNLQEWIQDDLFEYHLKRFENTPVLWRLTTERLVSDPQGEGFACLVDYRQLDTSLFDRIESRYLEPLKNEYRTKRNAADQRRSDSKLSTTEQTEAAEEYERYESALAQIDEFQEAAIELSSEHPRDWGDETQALAAEQVPKVTEFRNRTEERLETLDKLVDEMEPDEFEDLFSPTFLERVNENRDEWIDALEDLETACRAYSKDANQPVEAHLYDLFSYFDDLVGSTHYGSNGIFFMNYYFSKGEQYLDDGEPRDGLEGEIRLLAELAAETDEDVELGQEIKEDCNELSKAISSDWQERALSEVLTSGYDPVKKHGVAINIQPLAEKKIVPEIVEDKVIN